MRISIHKKKLFEALQALSKIVPSRTPLPILSNVLISCEKDRLKMITTDLEMSLEYIIPSEIMEEGAITVPVRILQDLISHFPDTEIQLQTEGNILKINFENSHYDINGISGEEFPVLPEIKEEKIITIPAENFKKMVNKTSYSVAPSTEPRRILTGILLEISKKSFKMVSTDGYRLSLVSKELSEKPPEDFNIVIPARGLNEVARLAKEKEDIKLVFSENQVRIDLENVSLFSRTIEGQFPPYQQIVSVKGKIKWKINKEIFIKALRRCSIIARDNGNVVKLKSKDNEIEISAGTSDVGTGYEKIPAECSGEKLEIAFNAGYLLDFLLHVDGEYINMELTDNTSAAIGTSEQDQENYISIIMPVRLS